MSAIFGIILILFGVAALLGVEFFKLAFALLLIFIGFRLLVSRRGSWGNRSFTSEDYINEVAIFSPLFLRVKAGGFQGGKIALIFGGGEIDLREVKTLQKEIFLDVVAIFGGCKIFVPKNWKVSSQGVGIVGGYNNRSVSENSDVSLSLKGVAIFGGVEIEN